VARYLAKRLLALECIDHPRRHNQTDDELGHASHHHTMHQDLEPGTAPPTRNLHNDEVCFSRADVLPVTSTLNGSWRLVDEGGAKGVPKLGLLSTAVGDRLDLEVWPNTRSCAFLQCALRGSNPRFEPKPNAAATVVRQLTRCACRPVLCHRVKLGYLVSTKRKTLGGISISCQGGACSRAVQAYPKLVPFPTFQTYAPFNDDDHLSDEDMTVTAFTAFFFMAEGSGGKLEITHVPNDGGARVAKAFGRARPKGWIKQNLSEIRVDSLIVEKQDIHSPEGRFLLRYNWNRSHTFRRQLSRFNATCDSGLPPGWL
jgi:hypothetical protein